MAVKDIRDWVDVCFKVVLAVAGIIVGYYFSFQKQQNDDITLVVNLATSTDSSKRILGWSLAQAYQRQNRLPQEVYIALISNSDVGNDPQLRKVVNSDVGAASKNDPGLKQAIASATEALPIRIYFHIRRHEDRTSANEILSDVEAAQVAGGKPIIVPGIQYVPGPQTRSILKCFKKAECATLGPQLVKIFQDIGVNISLSDQSPTYEGSSSIRPNHFEAWFAPPLSRTTDDKSTNSNRGQ